MMDVLLPQASSASHSQGDQPGDFHDSLQHQQPCSSQARRVPQDHPADGNSKPQLAYEYHHHQHLHQQVNEAATQTFVRNAVAQAVINRLHRWCCQLFWLTLVCVLGCCGDLKELNSANGKQQTLKQMRRNLVQCAQRSKGSMVVTELEMQLLRHLTNPQRSGLPMMAVIRGHGQKRRSHLSRPPSPQLFDIREELEVEQLSSGSGGATSE